MANIDQIGYHNVRSKYPIGVDNSMIELITRPWNKLIGSVKLYIKQWTKPVTTGLVSGILSDTTRSRVDLIAENALLRQQLIVLRRQVKRPQLTQIDRIRLVLLARCTSSNRTLCCAGIETCFATFGGASHGRRTASRVSPLKRSLSSGRWPRKTTCGVRSAFAVSC